MVEFKNGKIVTDLDDIDFFELILREWAQYDESEVEAILAAVEDDEINDDVLKTDGFDILDNTYFVEGELITLLKMGDGEWIVQGYCVEQMEEFVEAIQDNIDY